MNFTNEISSYFQHGDHSLALRRLLDASYDSGNAALMRKAISLSQSFRTNTGDDSSVKTRFADEADLLVAELQNEIPGFSSDVPLLTATKIRKHYTKGNFQLKPFDLSIHSREIIGVVGENGNGKTTLLRCLGGQLVVDAGKLEYHLFENADYYDIKHKVAFIPQRIPRWYGKLKDNLHFNAAIAGIKGEENDLMVDFMLERLGLSSFQNLTWDQISSGYRTRFELARILLQRPSLLILDEPLANLDINAQQTILTDLKFMTHSTRHPMGVLLSSQQLHEVEKVADSVLFIKNGDCQFRTDSENSSRDVYIELETKAEREILVQLFANAEVGIRYNGGFYTLTSPSLSAQDMLDRLVTNSIPISYFRDITNSTKRFFNS